MILPRVRVHKIAWNGNAGEVWYTDAGGAVDHLRALLGGFGFRFPVVKRGCSSTELQEVCRNDPGVEIGPREE